MRTHRSTLWRRARGLGTHNKHTNPTAGKAEHCGTCVRAEAPKGSVARVFTLGKLLWAQGNPCMGIDVRVPLRWCVDCRLTTKQRTGCKPVSIPTLTSRGVWVGSGDHVPCGREPGRTGCRTIVHGHSVSAVGCWMRMRRPFDRMEWCLRRCSGARLQSVIRGSPAFGCRRWIFAGVASTETHAGGPMQ